MQPDVTSLFLFVNHHRFSLEDAQQVGGSFELDNPKLGLEAQRHGVLVHLRREQGSVPIVVETRVKAPPADFDGFQLVSEGSFEAPSGELVLSSPGEHEPAGDRSGKIRVPAGWLRVQVRQADLDTTSKDAFRGAEHYRIMLWPAPQAGTAVLRSEKLGPRLLKPRSSLAEVERGLTDVDQTARCLAVNEALRQLGVGEKQGLLALGRATRDPAPAVRAVAVSALTLAHEKWRPAVCALLDSLAGDGVEEVQARLQDAYDLLKSEALIDVAALLPLLASRKAEAKYAGLFALSTLADSSSQDALSPAADALGSLSRDKDRDVSSLAASVLKLEGVKAKTPLRPGPAPGTAARLSWTHAAQRPNQLLSLRGEVLVRDLDSLVFLDAVSGRRVRTCFDLPSKHPTGALAGDTLLLADSAFEDGETRWSAIGFDVAHGAPRWRLDLGSRGDFGEPVAFGEAGVLRSGECIVAVDSASGKKLWELAAPEGETYEEAAACGEILCVRHEAPEVLTGWSRSGQPLWRVDAPGAWNLAPQGPRLVFRRNDLVGVRDAGTGKLVWEADVAEAQTIVSGEGLVAAIFADGRVEAFDLETGRARWQRTIEPVTQTMTPLLAASHLWLVDGARQLCALDARTGKPLSLEAPRLRTGECVVFSAADRVFLATRESLGQSRLFCFQLTETALRR